MTAQTKAKLTRQANKASWRLCDRYVQRKLKGSCPGCRLIDAVDERDYTTMKRIVSKYQRIVAQEVVRSTR